MTMLHAVENACATLFASSSLVSSSLHIYTGVDDDTKVAPLIICDANSAREEFLGSGVWHCNVDIKIRAMALDHTPAQFDTFVDTAYELILSESLDLGAYSTDLSVYQIAVVNSQQSISGDAWESMLTLDIVGVNNS